MINKKERFFGLDLVRVFACLMIIMVHSFSNVYNSSPMVGMGMFFFLMIRNVAFIGVPLFMILTGYFKSNKEMSKEYYKSIKKLLIVYVVVSIITIFFRKYYLNDQTIMYNYIIGIFNFSTIPYGWYFEMYIGLFLIIPFLNILYKNIKTKKQKIILIITLCLVSSIPSTFSTIIISNRSLNIMPDWWGKLYPILLYFIGCFIKEYKININKYINILLVVICLFLESFIMYFYCEGDSLNNKIIIDYNFFPAIILATLMFLLLYNINIRGTRIKSIFKCISNVTFCMYLISYIVDKFIYSKIIITSSNNIRYLIEIVFYTPIIFISSFILSFIIDKIIIIFSKILLKIKDKHNKKYTDV